MDDDLTLLRRYSRGHSEEAFATLVSRYVNLVYSVAMRQVRDTHLAEEIAQAVFIILARKADSLGDKTILGGWLCRTAGYVSANALKIQRRRQQREQEAYMQSTFDQSGTAPATHPGALEENWNQIAPLLDGALEKLGEKDHNAIVLRFFQNKSFAEVAVSLGASEDAAKMRVNRALEKLRKLFLRRGVVSTAAIIAGLVSAHSVQAAPAGLAKIISAAAVTEGAAVSTSTLTLMKGALKIMAWAKAKTAVVAGLVVVFAAGTTTAVVKHQHRTRDLFPGYATPQATFQSSMLAMKKGDLKALQGGYTPEFQASFMETAGKGKSEAEQAALFAKIADMIGNFEITGTEPAADGEIVLHFHCPRIGNEHVLMKKSGSDWKINGNITPDDPPKRVP